jgi:isochorismate synthase/2-succinyl-5-enolpyruvyl-6-hydroxy-3-cyclohexene-1-carboxylate synthase/2-succinyl-6-hydroxy-2,4-cyclohexadiene-1-carboxylate synthase/O-succinylbenzoate synthase
MALVKISNYELFRFSLPLTQRFRAGTIDIDSRSGLLLKIEDSAGHYGIGEILPLPGWHGETVDQCEAEIKSILWAAKGFTIPDHLEELSGGFESWYSQLSRTNIVPSVRCGFEGAMLHLLANTHKCSIAKLISDSPTETVSVNTLITRSIDETVKRIETALSSGYRAFKLKVGERSVEEDIRIVHTVRKQIGSHKLRLDANQSWSLPDAIQFLHGIEDCEIEYIEEPLQNSNELVKLCKQVPSARIALDESLMNTTPEQLEKTEGVTAIILKPPMFGIETTMKFARRAQSLGMTPVISSPFESGIGLAMSTALAAAIGDTPAGLESYMWLRNDLLQPQIPITNGEIALADCAINEDRINWSLLEKII